MRKILFIIIILNSFNLQAQCGFRSDYFKFKQDSIKSDSIKMDTIKKKQCHRDTPKSKETLWIKTDKIYKKNNIKK
jgi:hypothetical protein